MAGVPQWMAALETAMADYAAAVKRVALCEQACTDTASLEPNATARKLARMERNLAKLRRDAAVNAVVNRCFEVVQQYDAPPPTV